MLDICKECIFSIPLDEHLNMCVHPDQPMTKLQVDICKRTCPNKDIYGFAEGITKKIEQLFMETFYGKEEN